MTVGSVTVRDTGLAALKKRLATAERQHALTVGVHAEEGAAPHAGGATVIEIATINEFGLGVPERSFIRAWADAKAEVHKDNVRKLGRALVKGTVKDARAGLGQLGEAYVGEVQARIAGGIAPPNAPATVKRKGSSTPLVDKGILRSSIAARVDGQGAE